MPSKPSETVWTARVETVSQPSRSLSTFIPAKLSELAKSIVADIPEWYVGVDICVLCAGVDMPAWCDGREQPIAQKEQGMRHLLATRWNIRLREQ